MGDTTAKTLGVGGGSGGVVVCTVGTQYYSKRSELVSTKTVTEKVVRRPVCLLRVFTTIHFPPKRFTWKDSVWIKEELCSRPSSMILTTYKLVSTLNRHYTPEILILYHFERHLLSYHQGIFQLNGILGL